MRLTSRTATEITANRRARRGTTLIELLVVIVVFLIGILAVIQIFPKGFQLLVVTRNNSIAARLADDELERQSQHSDQLPEQIVAVHYLNQTTPVQDVNRDPYDLGPQGDSVDNMGMLYLSGTPVGNWLLHSGPNSFRRVVAETTRVPSPRAVGSAYGGLMVLNYGPVDSNSPITAYANDLNMSPALPPDLQSITTENVVTTASSPNPVSATLFDTSATMSGSQTFCENPTTSNAYLLLPTNTTYGRTYHIQLTAAFTQTAPSGFTGMLSYTDLEVSVPATTATDSAGNTPPLIQVSLGSIIPPPANSSFVGVVYSTVRVAPEYNLIANTASFSGDPLEYQILDPNVGTLLFSPAGYGSFIEQTEGPREPLLARVSYDVYDWRIIRQEFRLDNQQNLNGGNYGQFQLALQSLKVGNTAGPDGLPNGNIVPIESAPQSGTNPYLATQSTQADNFAIVDLTTGGLLTEADPNDGHQVVFINKSTGVITINGDGAGSGLMGYVIPPGGGTPIQVDLTSRPLRALYRARNEYSVNVLKAAASFSEFPSISFTGEGQYYVSGNLLQFPRSDLHQQVTIDTIDYIDSSGVQHEINGQSFQIENPTTNATGIPQIDLTSSLPAGGTLTGASGVKGSSIIAQVLWNPGSFSFGANATANINNIDTWEHSWRTNRAQTNIPAKELQ